MTSSSKTGTVGIIGAGTMGGGIAQVAATHGWNVHLMDIDPSVVKRASNEINARLIRLVEKGRMTDRDQRKAAERLRTASDPSDFIDCELVIEAVVEDLEAKTKVLRDLLPALRHDCIIATNTSSLSVSEIGRGIGEARRTVGMHFFNPAPLMKLVEVIAGEETGQAVVDRVAQIAVSWEKKVARAADVPGFIVNHVARPYYLEAFRILEDGYAAPDEIDRVTKELGGFRMGPFELTDFIGHDVNAATTRHVWERLDKPPLLRPSPLQEHLVEEGRLGRKTRKGVYEYSDGETASPVIRVERRNLRLSEPATEALDDFVSCASDPSARSSNAGATESRYVFARILAGLIVQAHLAFERGVAEKNDIDSALRYGVNYPKGPFEWTDQIGPEVCVRWLEELNCTVDDNRFALPESLRTMS